MDWHGLDVGLVINNCDYLAKNIYFQLAILFSLLHMFNIDDAVGLSVYLVVSCSFALDSILIVVYNL